MGDQDARACSTVSILFRIAGASLRCQCVDLLSQCHGSDKFHMRFCRQRGPSRLPCGTHSIFLPRAPTTNWLAPAVMMACQSLPIFFPQRVEQFLNAMVQTSSAC